MSAHLPLAFVKELASRSGFQDCGASKAELLPSDFFYSYLNLNYNASMLFMQNNIEKRLNPTLLFKGAETVFSFVLSYNNGFESDSPLHIATYAMCNDYHRLLKSKLYSIAHSIREIYSDFEFQICVDTAPVFEKIWAKKANLGWIGKNSLFTSRDYGSRVFLGEIICNYESDYPLLQEDDLCGDCILCLKACPNNAIDDCRNVDANRCISYHTKLNREAIPQSLTMQNYIFGCDLCLNACPHNHSAFVNRSEEVQPLKPVKDLLAKVSQNTFTASDLRKASKISGLENIKYSKFLSNIASAQV